MRSKKGDNESEADNNEAEKIIYKRNIKGSWFVKLDSWVHAGVHRKTRK